MGYVAAWVIEEVFIGRSEWRTVRFQALKLEGSTQKG